MFSGASGHNVEASGAFLQTYAGSLSKASGYGDNQRLGGLYLVFKASDSSTAYGNYENVNPLRLSCKFYIRH